MIVLKKVDSSIGDIMMSKFIEVHDKFEQSGFMPRDSRICINVDAIKWISKDGLAIIDANRMIECVESYDEIKQLIHDAGVLIHKPDPRLDTTTPLTMDDLRDMEGQPVWNSNALKWGLLTKQDGSYFLLYPTGQMWLFTVNDLIKFPLYRMRQ